ncbi:unnamed protein product [Coffea canephora]|uniref:Uncharacterized protein n=1 Tax=Coffea canephora TaxID=49390 RepID=A0A068UJB7_COFCA|nr:unnamed protein product [Coffea canephora]
MYPSQTTMTNVKNTSLFSQVMTKDPPQIQSPVISTYALETLLLIVQMNVDYALVVIIFYLKACRNYQSNQHPYLRYLLQLHQIMLRHPIQLHKTMASRLKVKLEILHGIVRSNALGKKQLQRKVIQSYKALTHLIAYLTSQISYLRRKIVNIVMQKSSILKQLIFAALMVLLFSMTINCPVFLLNYSLLKQKKQFVSVHMLEHITICLLSLYLVFTTTRRSAKGTMGSTLSKFKDRLTILLIN